MNNYNNPHFWAKVAGICKVLANHEGERVMIDRDDAEVFASLGEMRGRDMMRLAMGYDETKWIEEAII
jgi:hypothetical protein